MSAENRPGMRLEVTLMTPCSSSKCNNTREQQAENAGFGWFDVMGRLGVRYRMVSEAVMQQKFCLCMALQRSLCLWHRFQVSSALQLYCWGVAHERKPQA